MDSTGRQNNVFFGMMLLLTTEAMFFAGLISAYLVARGNAAVWPPADQPRLPMPITAINTVILVLSGLSAVVSFRKKSVRLMIIAAVLGLLFLLIQGSEWVRMLSFGLTTVSSIYGAFFYLIVGAHGVHVAAGLLLLLVLLWKAKNGSVWIAGTIYWAFVVAIWPVLYFLVYIL